MNKQHSDTYSVGKIWIEICLISARGLPRPALLKHQWYAVGWIDPTNKYCTKIDASGNPNPVWKTKFTTVIDTALDSGFRDAMLNIEVYSREPLFLREKLQGTASINLREFLCKYSKNSEGCKLRNEEHGSFQLRKKNDKPLGFIDVSVKVSDEKDGTSTYSFPGDEGGVNLMDNNNLHPPSAHPYTHPVPYPRNYPHPSTGMPSYPPATRPSYPAIQMPPPPPPPPPPHYNGGYVPTFLPQANTQSTSYINMPSSSSGAGRGAGIGPGVGVGLGAGALAAGAVIYGSDIMSGFELPNVMSNPSLAVSIDHPFW